MRERQPSASQPLRVIVRWGERAEPERIFDRTFTVGRGEDADIRLEHREVSRGHLRVEPRGEMWLLTDLGSTNGTFHAGARVGAAAIRDAYQIQLGTQGPILELSLARSLRGAAGTEGAQPAGGHVSRPGGGAGAVGPGGQPQAPSGARAAAGGDGKVRPPPPQRPLRSPQPARAVAESLLSSSGGRLSQPDIPVPAAEEREPEEDARIQEAPAREEDREEAAEPEHEDLDANDEGEADEAGGEGAAVEPLPPAEWRRLEGRYQLTIGGLVVALLLVLGLALFQQKKLEEVDAKAEELYFVLKDQELLAAKARFARDDSVALKLKQAIAMGRDAYLGALKARGLDEDALSYEELLILRVARAFGELETNIPPAFVEEVQEHIRQWAQGGRLEGALEKAKKNGYISRVAEELRAVDLPPQFLYIALKESNFDLRAVGPPLPAPMYFAKGMWQFIPSTAENMGLKVGDQVSVAVFDEKDERFDFEKSTIAFARYLRALYDSEAGASGLLVLACYNWGEIYVLPRIRQFPSDPRERNFWAVFLAGDHFLPDQTRDYIFSIYAAAVIGEDPRYFGFNLDPPLDD